MTTADTNYVPEMQPFQFHVFPAEEQLRRASYFFQNMNTRRTIRSFSPEPVSFALIETAIKMAATAPSGANSSRGDLSWYQIRR